MLAAVAIVDSHADSRRFVARAVGTTGRMARPFRSRGDFLAAHASLRPALVLCSTESDFRDLSLAATVGRLRACRDAVPILLYGRMPDAVSAKVRHLAGGYAILPWPMDEARIVAAVLAVLGAAS